LFYLLQQFQKKYQGRRLYKICKVIVVMDVDIFSSYYQLSPDDIRLVAIKKEIAFCFAKHVWAHLPCGFLFVHCFAGTGTFWVSPARWN
jgi:hypothetical protein